MFSEFEIENRQLKIDKLEIEKRPSYNESGMEHTDSIIHDKRRCHSEIGEGIMPYNLKQILYLLYGDLLLLCSH